MDKASFRIIFMGTPEFAVPSLQTLVEHGFQVVAVVTAPDKPKGRGRKLSPSPVKEYALSQDIPVLQPTNLKSPVFVEELQSYRATLQIVVAFRMLPVVVWEMPEIGTFNLHASLLPQYRGAAPINWAIINGETETGATTFMLKHEIDTGDMLFQEKEPIYPDDTLGTLYERLRHKGAGLVLKTTGAILSGNYTLQPQPGSEELHKAPKLTRETCEINWQQPAEQVRNFIRGLSPFPGAWTHLTVNGQALFFKIFYAERTGQVSANLKPGEYQTSNKSRLLIQTSDELLSVTELQAEGKKKMKTEDFLRGNTL
jgi:methionyl-tRNA formyltransferase